MGSDIKGYRSQAGNFPDFPDLSQVRSPHLDSNSIILQLFIVLAPAAVLPLQGYYNNHKCRLTLIELTGLVGWQCVCVCVDAHTHMLAYACGGPENSFEVSFVKGNFLFLK